MWHCVQPHTPLSGSAPQKRLRQTPHQTTPSSSGSVPLCRVYHKREDGGGHRGAPPPEEPFHKTEIGDGQWGRGGRCGGGGGGRRARPLASPRPHTRHNAGRDRGLGACLVSAGHIPQLPAPDSPPSLCAGTTSKTVQWTRGHGDLTRALGVAQPHSSLPNRLCSIGFHGSCTCYLIPNGRMHNAEELHLETSQR